VPFQKVFGKEVG
jgi:NAD(P)H-nitrite reductase large subunit